MHGGLLALAVARPTHRGGRRARDACDLWSDIIDLEGATPIATYADAYYAGRAAATRHAFGQGSAYYLGTRPDQAGMAWLLDRACADAGVRPAYIVPEGVEVVRRESQAGRLLYLLNHRATPAEIALEHDADDLLTGQHLSGTFTLGGQEIAILTTPTSKAV